MTQCKELRIKNKTLLINANYYNPELATSI